MEIMLRKRFQPKKTLMTTRILSLTTGGTKNGVREFDERRISTMSTMKNKQTLQRKTLGRCHRIKNLKLIHGLTLPSLARRRTLEKQEARLEKARIQRIQGQGIIREVQNLGDEAVDEAEATGVATFPIGGGVRTSEEEGEEKGVVVLKIGAVVLVNAAGGAVEIGAAVKEVELVEVAEVPPLYQPMWLPVRLRAE
jgi:hypothetical protein